MQILVVLASDGKTTSYSLSIDLSSVWHSCLFAYLKFSIVCEIGDLNYSGNYSNLCITFI